MDKDPGAGVGEACSNTGVQASPSHPGAWPEVSSSGRNVLNLTRFLDLPSFYFALQTLPGNTN